MEEATNQTIDKLRRKLVFVFGSSYSVAVVVSLIINLVICFQGSWESGNESCLYMVQDNRYSITEYLQSDGTIVSTLVLFLRVGLSALLLSTVFDKSIVTKFYQLYPLNDVEDDEEKVIINYTINQYCNRGTETDTIYFKQRRRTVHKTNIIREKTLSEMKKIHKKERNLTGKYQMKETKIRKDIGCKDILIGELEFRKATILTHLTQLKYYVIHSRNELEIQRDRNKAIPDTVDTYGNLVSSSLLNAQMVY